MRSEFDPIKQEYHYYHVVPIKNISIQAQSFNARKVIDEFWEDLGNIPFFTPIAYATCSNNYDIFEAVITLFKTLDDSNLKYTKLNQPLDFIKKHIITDGSTNIILCNKHLLTKTSSQRYYTKDCWLKTLLKALFPNIDSANKEGIPTNTPQWAINMYLMSKNETQSKKNNKSKQ